MRSVLRALVVGIVVVVGFVPGLLGGGSNAGVAAQAAAEGLPMPGEPWDLVFMTDSTGWGVAGAYAERAEAALGVEVRVHDLTQGGLRAVRMLERLDQVAVAEQFAAAEIIVVFGNPEGSGVQLPEPDIGTCVSTSSYVRQPPAASQAADWAAYREVLGSAFERIWELRDGKPTVFRAVDMYSPVLGPWEAGGVLAECTREWVMMSDQIRAAAEAHGVVMVSIFDALNGPKHDRDLVELGWVLSDGEHLNADGVEAAADALADAGFEPVGSSPAR